MKTASAGMIAHLESEAQTRATLWRIVRRDAAVYTFTDHNRDIVYGGETYAAALGYRRAAITSGADLAVDETELEGLLDSASISEAELRAGVWDGAEVRIFEVNWADLTQGELKLRRGTLGEVVIRDDGSFKSELRGLAQPLQQTVGAYYQAECRADLGDARCKIPLRPALRQDSTAYALGAFVRVVTASVPSGTTYDHEGAIYECTTAGTSDATSPTFNLTTGATTADGSVVWTTRAGWTRPATIGTVTDSVTLVLNADGIEAYADGWFEGGVAVWETGANAGAVREVIGWVQSTRTLSLLAPPPLVPEVGDIIRIQPGCDKRKATCQTKFANYLNFRGEPFVPGALAILETPL
jgi:hypothetical protein